MLPNIDPEADVNAEDENAWKDLIIAAKNCRNRDILRFIKNRGWREFQR